jgi:hypothetical protein
MQTRLIFINNVSIRRAIEDMKASTDYEDLCRVLVTAFRDNDFDGFELCVDFLPDDYPYLEGLNLALARDGDPCLRWQKPRAVGVSDETMVWSLTLDLAGTSRRLGAMRIYRVYAARDLQLDINLLTSGFPRALGDALERHLSPFRGVDSHQKTSLTSRTL